MRTKDLENYIIAENIKSQQLLTYIQYEVEQLLPTKGTGEIRIEHAIKELQDKIGIENIRLLACRYNVVIFDDLYIFLVKMQSLDKRDIELRNEVKVLDRNSYIESKNRLNIILMAKYFRQQTVTLKTKCNPAIDSKDRKYNEYISKQILKKLFQDNKDFYCHELKWNEEKNVIEDAEIDMLSEVEEKRIEIYKQLKNNSDREIAIEIKLLAQLLHKVDFMNDILNNEVGFFNAEINEEYSYTWADSVKSCFMVDLLLYFNVIQSYIGDKTPQEKYQYIKSKLKQANNFLSKT